MKTKMKKKKTLTPSEQDIKCKFSSSGLFSKCWQESYIVDLKPQGHQLPKYRGLKNTSIIFNNWHHFVNYLVYSGYVFMKYNQFEQSMLNKYVHNWKT
jgi:hypothetical protein